MDQARKNHLREVRRQVDNAIESYHASGGSLHFQDAETRIPRESAFFSLVHAYEELTKLAKVVAIQCGLPKQSKMTTYIYDLERANLITNESYIRVLNSHDMRNILAHTYFGIDYDMVQNVIENECDDIWKAAQAITEIKV